MEIKRVFTKNFPNGKAKRVNGRKQFEQEKKMQTAIAIINTATAAIGAFAALSPPPIVGLCFSCSLR